MIYSKGDVVIADFPFSSGAGSKARPALVVFDSGDSDTILARMTSRAAKTPFDLVVVDWQAAGLRGLATVRLDKLNTTAKTLIHNRIGTLTAADYQRVAAVFNQIFGAW